MKSILMNLVIFIVFTNFLYAQTNKNISRAQETLDSIYKYYSIHDSQLLREHYPYKDDYKADYLGGGENSNKANPYAYLWPYSGSLSATVALYENTKSKQVLKNIDTKVLVGLAEYFDTRKPVGYASYVNSAPQSDRFYDDNVWLGIDFTDLYLLTKEKQYLDKALEIWAFVESGMDEKLGGGIYWCEQRQESKNTCSNAPSVVYLAKLYEATKENKYLSQAEDLYKWTQQNLIDWTDHVYFDNINLKGEVDKRKYAYNTGQMIQAGALLYKLTRNKQYLTDAQNAAKGGFNHFFYDEKDKDSGKSLKILQTSNNWFIAVMMRGYVELYHVDKNKLYIDAFQKNLDHAWKHMRESNGLFNKDWSGSKQEKSKWVLDQFAIVEMYSKMAQVK
ncbi:glycoside hydrolase family 76 protein [Sphingobacterium cavernae]|uniref:glycoside hydrolase family 76 protein n=1 Tax=Sphingobacterium cavernae TaxID=2592657 RepID=UPI0012302129|nr:glycoside hydrolase family 76 protein [Sphingobacterium cavernae]